MVAMLSEIFKEANYYQHAVSYLNSLQHSRSVGYRHFCWGYPFNWVTQGGTVNAGTPLITSTPYAYEAFEHVYRIDANNKWLSIMHSIAEHVMQDIKDTQVAPQASTCSYTPDGGDGVINANAYRAYLLASASIQHAENKYWEVAERNLNFVLQSQKPNGSWPYAVDAKKDFIDHFHTCFVLKALAKIEKLIDHERCTKAIEKGVAYYVDNLFNSKQCPKPFSKAPRLTIYRSELYDYAECINLGMLLKGRFPELDKRVYATLNDLLDCWQKPDGSFRSRKLIFGWDNVPMHRWAQSQLFRSLCFSLYQGNQN